ncbi:MAG TPA: hypothetical protein VL463_28750 [Kofleriaceae bacterium]|nr:hypothetical protein [Kofleriaceae bacterium]
MTPAAETLRRIERLNYLFGIAMVLVSLAVASKAFVGGVMVGVAITCLNFAVMRALGSGLTKHVAAGGSPGKAMILLPKTIVLMAVVALALAFLPIDPLGFVMGFSIILLSITTEAVISIVRPPAATTSPDEQHHG